MTGFVRRVLLVLSFGITGSAMARAQQVPIVPSFDRGTALGVLVGGASSTHLSGATVVGIVNLTCG